MQERKREKKIGNNYVPLGLVGTGIYYFLRMKINFNLCNETNPNVTVQSANRV